MLIERIQELKQTTGRLLGVDFGDVRTGLAVSDAARFLASGLETIKPGSMTKTAEAVAEAARAHGVVGIIVGLPVNMNGSQGERAEHARMFAAMLDERVGEMPILLLDERMTTMAASRFLNETNTRGQKRKQVIDTLSAQIILQNALDRLKNC
ncbi:MAG: Holliday junction resolvase RuvX [Ruminococcaceae bacterium]|nr:Holliday junction resolvase RuvX [Oscillospiraceae bacterium]